MDVFFLTEDDNLLRKYNTIWDTVSSDVNKKFDGEPVYNFFFLKIEIKTYSDEATDFHDTIIHKCFLKKYNYTEKEKKSN